MQRTGTEPELLLEELLVDDPGPRVVAVGGGHGLAAALAGIRGYAGRVDAVVTVADDGGSSGRLAALDIPPPGDIRQCLVALTPDDSVWRRLFEYRFEGADVTGHSLGNLLLAALADLEGSFEGALEAAGRLLGSVGSVIPAAPTRLRLHADLDGRRVEGQVAISLARGRIRRLWVEPGTVRASPRALEALEAADQIVLGPGSLYTSVLATLVVPGIVEAINRSRAELVFVMNLTTQDGETLGMGAAEHLAALLDLTGLRVPGAIVASAEPIRVDPPLEPVRVDPEALATFGVDVVLADLLDRSSARPAHDPDKLGGVLGSLAHGRSER
ncbi:MAG TPA: YvcK family protein [Actinobacteria bacterium]|nr:YvcK family protein [Actinomycetota bacterium]